MFGLFTVSKAWRDRLPGYRLKATLAEVVLRGRDFAIFSAEDCNIETGEIAVDLWRDGQWVQVTTRTMDVVMFFGGAPSLKRQKDVLEWLSNRFPVVRARGPDKAQLPAYLEGSPVAARVIPQIILGPDNVGDALMTAMNQYGSIVVKLAASSSGRGVRFVIDDGGVWHLRDSRQSASGTMEEIATLVERDLAGRAGYRAIVVQKFVRSRSGDGRALQFRVDVARDGAGEWHVLKSFAHLAEIGEFASNIAFGGYLGSLERVVAQRSARPASEIFDDAIHTALETARALDSHADVSIFELGVDMLIDDEDHIWLLEANLQPETTSYEQRRAEFAVGYALAVAASDRPLAESPVREDGHA